jgi:hypothetical protein
LTLFEHSVEEVVGHNNAGCNVGVIVSHVATEGDISKAASGNEASVIAKNLNINVSGSLLDGIHINLTIRS